MNKSDKAKVIKNEIIAGLLFGAIVGTSMAILAFLALTILYLTMGKLVFLTAIAVWVSYAMISTLYYKPFPWAIYRNISFFVGLLATVSLMNYAYNIMAYNIDLPYSSLRTVKIIALVIIGSAVGLAIKTIVKPKKIAEKEIAQ